MQKWLEKFKEGKEDPTGEITTAHKVADSIKKGITLGEGVSGVKAMEFFSWLASQNEGEQKLDIKTSIVNNFYLLESRVGRENFDKALEYYQKYRNDIFRNTPTTPGITGITGPIGPIGT